MNPSAKPPKKRAHRRPRYFYLIALLLPFVLLALTEAGLRLAGVARPLPFFVRLTGGFRPLLQINPKIGLRFFPPSLGTGIPVPSYQVLSPVKSAGARRILCLGESTTAGFPFPVYGAFPALLQIILEERDPATRWDVTNCGLTGISSATVAAVTDELLTTGADVLVVYLGHNEFFGVGGVGSRGMAAGGWLAAVRDLRISRLLEKILVRRAAVDEPGTLMERIVGQTKISPGSSLRRKAASRFRGHLETILKAAAAKGVRVILCEVVSNERDLYPFGSVGKNPVQISGVEKLGAGPSDPQTAQAMLPLLDQAVSADTLHAGLRYLRGLARARSGQDGAGTDLIRARSLDAVPFRAPDLINGVIREEAAKYHAELVPTEQIFRSAVPGGVPGWESFVEHLHPTFFGNARIAAGVAEVLLGGVSSPVSSEDAGRWFEKSDLTRLDLALADAHVQQLLHRWPYTRTGEDVAPYPYRARSLRTEAFELLTAVGDTTRARRMKQVDPDEDGWVQKVLNRKCDLLEAHRQMALSRFQRGDLAEASRELRACTRLYPVDSQAWVRLAQVRLQAGDRTEAKIAAKAALYWNPGTVGAQEVLRKLGE